jgi:RNA polymerase sigma-70 factor, ECF subfamily
MLQTAMVPMLEASDEHVFTDALSPALVVRGENWALSGIYGPYAGLVFSIALKILNDQSGAEEIVQKVLTKVWRHAQDHRLEGAKFSAWVGTITRHQDIDDLRHRRARPITTLGYWECIDWLADNDDPARDAQGTLEQVSTCKALQHIPFQERITIELACWGRMSHREVAFYYDSPPGTVKTRLRLGMQRWKLLLQESECLDEAIQDEQLL